MPDFAADRERLKHLSAMIRDEVRGGADYPNFSDSQADAIDRLLIRFDELTTVADREEYEKALHELHVLHDRTRVLQAESTTQFQEICRLQEENARLRDASQALVVNAQLLDTLTRLTKEFDTTRQLLGECRNIARTAHSEAMKKTEDSKMLEWLTLTCPSSFAVIRDLYRQATKGTDSGTSQGDQT